MLPLMINVLPTPTLPTSSSSATVPSVLQTGTDAAASANRQQLPTAVSATAAPVAYFPGTPPAKTQVANGAQRVAVPPPTGDYIDIDQPPAATPQQIARPSTPITLGIPLTTQLSAQFMAQQTTSATTARASADPFPIKQADKQADAEPAASTKKEATLSKARGTAAYGIAAERSQQVNSAPDIEAA